ncbi:MAG: 23S rRNA pseudouridine synthase [Puniceicoccaceae bacterium 5H]|nr:MAG: 23S rRNA pseudouridine synthase [Puniceicoccaceae bacterium 5H]
MPAPSLLLASEAALIQPEWLEEWIVLDDDEVLVLNKPGWVVCHPSKNGPWSSLVGAVKEWRALKRVHLVARLDRETSGLVVLAKHRLAARNLQMALEARSVTKRYLAFLEGVMTDPVTVDEPIGRDPFAEVAVMQMVRPERRGQSAVTHYQPLANNGRLTLALVTPHTGRKHQIRVHAAWLGHPVVGDKIYGGHPEAYLEFIRHGWTGEMSRQLRWPRQALHAFEVTFNLEDGPRTWQAPLAPDLQDLAKIEHLPLDLPVSGSVEGRTADL